MYLRFDTAYTQFLYKTVPISKWLSVPMSTTQLASQFYNTTYSVLNGLKDGTVEVTHRDDRSSKNIHVPLLASCVPLTSVLPKMWEDIASRQHDRYNSSTNFEKAFAQCKMGEDGEVHPQSRFLTAPWLSIKIIPTYQRFPPIDSPMIRSTKSPPNHFFQLRPRTSSTKLQSLWSCPKLYLTC